MQVPHLTEGGAESEGLLPPSSPVPPPAGAGPNVYPGNAAHWKERGVGAWTVPTPTEPEAIGEEAESPGGPGAWRRGGRGGGTPLALVIPTFYLVSPFHTQAFLYCIFSHFTGGEADARSVTVGNPPKWVCGWLA